MPDGIAADYSLKPSELAETLAVLVEARQPTRLHRSCCCAHSSADPPGICVTLVE